MESLITEPIEAELEGVEGLDKLTSTSRFSLSTVVAEFTGDTAVETALRRVRERVDVARTGLPADVDPPGVRELNFSDQPFLIMVLSNPNGLQVMEGAVDFFEEEIKAIPGVLDVRVSGSMQRELAIELDPARLKQYGFSIDDVMDAVRAEHVTIPGGHIRNSHQQLDLAVTGEIKDAAIFGEIVVRKGERHVRLKSLGKVGLGYKAVETLARLNGEPAISLAVTKKAGENMLRVVSDIRRLAKTHGNRLPHGTKVDWSWDESEKIRDMVYDLENNIITSFVLVVLVTLFFLGPVNAVFVSIGIPFSMLISFTVLSIMGITLNMVVLFSLVLALGMLVDNGIVTVENIYRHRSLGKSRIDAAAEGVGEVAVPVATSTLTTTLAFLPIIFMPDIMGEFMSYLPKTVIIVLFSSLLVALSITPAFCSRFLNLRRQDSSGKGMGRLPALYERALRQTLQYPWRTLVFAFAMVIGGIVLYTVLGRPPVFFPALDPDVVKVEIEVEAGASVQRSDAVARKVADQVPGVPASLESVQTTVGRTGGGMAGGGLDPAKASLRLGFVPWMERQIPARDTMEALKEKFRDFVDGSVRVTQEKNGPPQGHAISYEIRGQDYGVIGALADKVKAILARHEQHFEEVDYDFEEGKPELRVQIDRQRAARYGLDTRSIAGTVRHAFKGGVVGQYHLDKEELDVVVRYASPFRDSLPDLKKLEIVDGDERIPLAALGEIRPEATVSIIKRNSRRRAVNVWADFLPDLDDRQVVRDVREGIARAVAELQVPPGYSIVSGEGSRTRDRSTAFLANAFLVALALIFLVLVIQFNSVTQPLIIMISVFLSLGGVFWGLLLTGKTFVIIMSGIGVISLAGIVVNNAIVLIDFINVLGRGGMDWREAVIRASCTRFRPVLLTALTTVIGLIPMAFAVSFDFHTLSFQVGSQSAQWFRSMAWAIIFGLSFATLLTLFVVPVLMLLDRRLREGLVRVPAAVEERIRLRAG